MITIYKITNLKNNKCYVGQTSQKLKKRVIVHKSISSSIKHKMYNSHLYCAIRKYGWENFKVEILEIVDTSKADITEQNYIAKFFCTDRKYGYNINHGGHKQKIVSLETKQKMSKAWKYEKHFNAEICLKISNSNKGKRKPERSKEHCKKLSNSNGDRLRKLNINKQKSVKQIDCNTGEEKTYNSVNSTKLAGFSPGNVCNACKNNIIYKGFYWRYSK